MKSQIWGETNSDATIREQMNERFADGTAYQMGTLWDVERGKELERQVFELMSPWKGKRILDLCCGEGGLANIIKPKDVKEYVGLELSDVAVKIARGKYGDHDNFKFIQGDAEEIPFAEKSFDLVVAREAIEHLPHPDKCIAGAYRVLKPGGALVISSPNRNSLHLRINRALNRPDFTCSSDHIKEFTFREATELLHNSGFEIVKTSGAFLMPYWGVMENQTLRQLTDNDSLMVKTMRDLGRLVGAEYAFCYLIRAQKPKGGRNQ